MKRTIHINLAGHAFSIDEDAFERLDTYLKAVKSKLGDSEEAEETLDDINLRIAELFRGVHHDATSAITLSDVEEVIKTLGDPGDYEEPGDPDAPKEETISDEPPMRKQLFRDPDNRFLGGVCSGLGNYFGLDPILFRLLFILATILYGTSLLVYIILWIAIPKAVTVQQRIMMMGGAPGSESWRKRQMMPRSNPGDAMNDVVRVIAIVAGLFLVIVSFLSLMGVIMTFSLTDVLFGAIFSNSAWIPQVGDMFLLPSQRLTGVIGLALAIGIPLLVLFYLGMHLVFRFKRGGATFLIVALILWLTGIGMGSYTAISIAKDYTNKQEVEERKNLVVPNSDTIYIQPSQASLELGEGQHIFSKDGMSIKKRENELLLIGTPDFELKQNSEAFKITVEKNARGKNSETALKNANNIEYFFLQNDSLLMLDRYFSVQNKSLMRGQQVNVIVEVPEDKVVKIADEFKYLIPENSD